LGWEKKKGRETAYLAAYIVVELFFLYFLVVVASAYPAHACMLAPQYSSKLRKKLDLNFFG